MRPTQATGSEASYVGLITLKSFPSMLTSVVLINFNGSRNSLEFNFFAVLTTSEFCCCFTHQSH